MTKMAVVLLKKKCNMKNYFLVCIVLVLFLSQKLASQTLEKKLENTYWKMYQHQANADTWFLEALKTKPVANPKFEYLYFGKNNTYLQFLDIGRGCKGELAGHYKIEKSQIVFTVTDNRIPKACQEENDYRYTHHSIILKNGILHLTRPKAWYDEEIKKKGDTILIKKEQMGRIMQKTNGKYEVTDASRIPFDDGIYKMELQDDDGKYIFSSKNSYMDGEFISIANGKGYIGIYRDGILKSEKRYINNQLFFEKSIREDVKKETSGHYRITLTELNMNSRVNEKDSIITIFDDKIPVSKIRYENNKLKSEMDFKNNIFKRYRSNGKLEEMESADTKIIYDYNGVEKSKEIYKNNTFELYNYGKLKSKKIFEKDKTTTLTYDEQGKVIDTNIIENKDNMTVAEVADMDKYEPKLSQEKFEYYKKLAK